MGDAAAETSVDYGSLVEEVFLGPIRTVVAVDDDFPTFDSLLDAAVENGDRGGGKDQGAVKMARDILRFCHDPKRRWLVEIHDGKSPAGLDEEQNAAGHFHQSDLMILDYHLGTDPADGSEAIKILRRIAENDHFNLVIVYTKGYDAVGSEIERVAREIAVGLNVLDPDLRLGERALRAAEKCLNTLEESEPEIREKLEDSVDEGLYVKLRSLASRPVNWGEVCKWRELEALDGFIGDGASCAGQAKKLLVKWAFHRRQEELTSRLATEQFRHVSFAWCGEGVNWIRTERLFVTVVGKDHPPQELPGKLLAALKQWKPEPHRLLMSKMRAQLDEQGVLAEGVVLSNPHLQTAWLQDLVVGDEGERRWRIGNTVRNHWDGLGSAIRRDVSEFAERLAGCLLQSSKSGVAGVLQEHAPIQDFRAQQRDIVLHRNRYVCSKPVEGWHLTTGDILELDGPTNEDRYWICLTPACDLEPGPGRGSSGWRKRLNGNLPFIAVQLFNASADDAVGDATGGNYLFLDLDGKPACFRFTPAPPGRPEGQGEHSVGPKLEQMFAERQGVFEGDSARTLSVGRAAASDGARAEIGWGAARVVGQLRYEYALNLLQRLGANLSRVGVDFTSWRDGVAAEAVPEG